MQVLISLRHNLEQKQEKESFYIERMNQLEQMLKERKVTKDIATQAEEKNTVKEIDAMANEAQYQKQINFYMEKANQLELLMEDKEAEFHETLIKEKETI
jgi:hypothetical protein